jgi:hypothetical protein
LPDFSVQPAAHEDAKADARAAAKWLIAAFAAVGAVLVSGVGLSSFAGLSGGRLALGSIAFLAGTASVIAAVSIVGDVLTPEPVTLRELARRQSWRNEGDPLDRDWLIEYLEADPSFFQGITAEAPEEETLIAACGAYEEALNARYGTAETYWRAEEEGARYTDLRTAEKAMKVADTRSQTIHLTVRRLEQIAAAQQTVLAFRDKRGALALLAASVAASIGVFAAVAGS